LAAVTSASAAEQSSTKDQGSSATKAPADQSSATQTPPSQAGTTTSATKDVANKELSGVVKKVDKDKQSLKVLSSAGVEQDVKIAPSATITRDGTKAELEQLKEGDEVRASFDPSSNQATKLEIQSSAAGSKTDSSDMKSKSDTSSDTKSKSDSSSKKY